MDKETLSNYGWIVICVLVISVMIALATPFGQYVKTGVENTTQGLFDVENKAMSAIGISVDGIKTYTYSQTNEIMQKYLDEVDYTGVDYSTSLVLNYTGASITGYDKSKPAGFTLELPAGNLTVTDNGTGNSYTKVIPEGDYTFYNITPGVGGEFVVKDDSGNILEQGHLRPTNGIRLIKTNGTKNVRDIGGWNCNGGTIKYGKIYRGGWLNINDKDLFTKELGIKTEIDVSASGESVFGASINYVSADQYAMYSILPKSVWQYNLSALFENIRNGNPVYFHCTMGADRTGTFACVIEGLLGMSQNDIDKDYELTSFAGSDFVRERDKNYQGANTDYKHFISSLNGFNGETFEEKCIAFVLSLGFSIDDINEFRSLMINGSPSTVEMPAVVNLFDKNDEDVFITGRFNSSHNVVAYQEGQLVTGYIPCLLDQTFCITSDRAYDYTAYSSMINVYDGSKNYLGMVQAAYRTVSDNKLQLTFRIPHEQFGDGVKYFRVCIAYENIDNISIVMQ